jgi:hypothetical protein
MNSPRKLLCIVSFGILGLGITAGRAVADDGFAELLAKVPPGANTLVMLNAEQIFASEVATSEGWKQHYQATYADAPLLLPPRAQQFLLAAQLDLGNMKPNWQAAVIRLASDPSLTLIARNVRGQTDTVADLEVVVTPRGAMIVNFAPRLFGLMYPGSRQSVARWIRDASSNNPNGLSPYLQAAAAVTDRVGTEIIMAIDMQDALGRDRIRQGIERSAVLRDALVNLDGAADALASLRGVTLGIRVTQRTYGKLKIDFSRDVSVLADVAKPLVLEVLSEAGAEIDEFNDWNVAVADKQITLDGELTRNGLRRLFSFLELDATGVDAPADGGPMELSGSAAQAATAKASQEYFQSVTRYLGDLKRERGAVGYNSIALWFDKYARRIDRLPILGVDKDLVNYGGYVVGQLRDCVEAIKGSAIRSGSQSAQVTSGQVSVYDSGYQLFAGGSRYASAEIASVEEQRRSIRAQERGQSSTDVRAIIREIQEETSRIRREMTERYQVEFVDTPGR